MLVIYFPDVNVTSYQLIGATRVEGKDVISAVPLASILKSEEGYLDIEFIQFSPNIALTF